MKLLKCLNKAKVPSSTALRSLVLVLKDCLHTLPKHGVIGLTKTAALEYAEQGIRVNAVCPGVIQTPMMDRLTEKKKEAIEQFTALEPVGRMGQPEEIANAVVWMCSDEASL
jgi:NAD(P)-dependent dehydrogenase (short-subunit alcohol dehydrogenase family)